MHEDYSKTTCRKSNNDLCRSKLRSLYLDLPLMKHQNGRKVPNYSSYRSFILLGCYKGQGSLGASIQYLDFLYIKIQANPAYLESIIKA